MPALKPLFSWSSLLVGGLTATLLASGCAPEGGAAPESAQPGPQAPDNLLNPPSTPGAQDVGGALGQTEQGIVNGVARPFIDSTVGLADSTGFVFCSGTVVSPYVVQTAAHCLDSPVASVLFGGGQNNGIYVPVRTQAKHPAYAPSPLGTHDVGVVVLAWRAPDRAGLAVLGATPPAVGSAVTITGYGYNGVGPSGTAGQKHTLNVTVQGVDAAWVRSSNACNGDSGGPLYYPMNSRWVHGVASFVNTGCGGNSWHMRSDLYRPWVLSYVAQFGGLDVARRFGDYNGDGRADFIWRNQNGTYTTWGAGDATVDNAWQVIAVGDMNGDGVDEFIWRHLDGTVFANGQQWVVGNDYQIVAVGDMNGNGVDDFVWRHQNGSVVVWGVGTWSVDNSWQLAGVADLNGDGVDDFIWRHASGYVTTWGAYGDHNVDNSWRIAGFGDIDGNGTVDFVWRHASGAITVWGVGDFGTLGLDWNLVGLADLDGDGTDNFVWRNNNGHTVAWGVADYGVVSLDWDVMPLAR